MIECVCTLPKRSIYLYMFKNIIKKIGHRAFSQATGYDKMTHFVWIIQEKTPFCDQKLNKMIEL